MQQLIPHSERNKDVIEQLPKRFGAIDENQIMERTSVGNDDAAHLFGDAAKTFQIGCKLFAFANSESLGVLQKSIGLKTVQFEKFPDLSVRELAFSECLDDKGLQRLAREFGWLCTNRL